MPAANPVDLEAFTPVLKNVYLPFRENIFPKLTPLLAQVRSAGPDEVRYAGNDLFFDVKVGPRGGFVSSASGFFPTSKQAAERQGRLSISRTYAQTAVDGLALKAASSERGAFISVAKKVTEDIMEQWEREQERILFGDSRGIRAVIDTRTDDDTKDVDNPYGRTGAGPGNLWLATGDDIAIVDSTDFTVHGKAQIDTDSSLSGDTYTMELTGNITGDVAGDFVVTAVPTSVDTNDTSFGVEPHGLLSITDPATNFATFEGINDSRWVARTNTSSTVDETTLMTELNIIRARSGVDWRKNPEEMLVITPTGIWQTYGESLLGIRRFSAPEMTLQGGFTGVKVGDATLIDDPWCPRQHMFFVYTPSLIFVDLMDFGKLSFEDSPQWQLSSTQDQYTATFGAYWNFGTLKRNAHGVLSGITDSTNFSPVF